MQDGNGDGDGVGVQHVEKTEGLLEGGVYLRIYFWGPTERTVVLTNKGDAQVQSQIQDTMWVLGPGEIHIFRQHRDTPESEWPPLESRAADRAWEYSEEDVQPLLDAVGFMAEHWEGDHSGEPLDIYISRPAIGNHRLYQWDGKQFQYTDATIKLLSREEEE